MCTMPIGQGLPSLATIMFNRQVQGIMPLVDRKPLGQDHDDDHHIKLVERQRKNDNDTSPVIICRFLILFMLSIYDTKVYFLNEQN